MRKERIKASAWRDPRSGVVYTGVDHYDCWCKALDADPVWNKVEELGAADWAENVITVIGEEAFFKGEGFITTENRFVDRAEALAVAKACDQVGQSATNGLRAEEMIGGQ